MFVSRKIIGVLFFVLFGEYFFANDLNIIAINSELTKDTIHLELLIQNKSENDLYIVSPEIYKCYENVANQNLYIQTFSEKSLNGDFSLDISGIPIDNCDNQYIYNNINKLEKDDYIVLFFDIFINELLIRNEMKLKSLYDYNNIILKVLYSKNAEFQTVNENKIQEFDINLKRSIYKTFNIYDYIDKWDTSVIFLRRK